MEHAHGVIPRGEHEGTPCFNVSLAPHDDPERACDALAQALTPGVGAVYLSEAPWGSELLEEFLGRFYSDPRLAELRVVATRDVRESEWASAEVDWIADGTFLLSAPVSRADLVKAIGALPYQPHPQDLIVRAPDVQNIHPALLDELFTRLDPRTGWIYAPHGATKRWFEPALSALVLCDTPWKLRRTAT